MKSLSSSEINSPIKTPFLRRKSAETDKSFETVRFSNFNLKPKRLRSVARGVSSGEESGAFGNGFGFLSDDGLSWFESNANDANESGVTGASGFAMQGSRVGLLRHLCLVVCKSNATDANESDVTGASGFAIQASRVGLLRTPMSGGVQSATSVHDLPPPALAVRNLMEQARFANLSTLMSRMHHHREGYPFGSLVDFAPDPIGHPIFSLSPLAIHTRNLLANSKCSLVVQIPGWSALSNARVTIFGDVFPLPSEQQEWAREQYLSKHQQWASQQWGNFYYYRMQNVSDIYFIGGFGTVAWIDVEEYENLQPDKIAVNGGEQNLKELNALFSKSLREMLSNEVEIDDAAFISIDSKGTDIRVRQNAQFKIQRLSFEMDRKVETLEEAKKALQKIIKAGLRS